jgi:hypothetical protein
MLLNLSGQVEKLVECNQMLVGRLDDQQVATRELARRLERADERDRMLMETLRLMQENAHRQIAAATEPGSRKTWFGWGRKRRE